MFILSLAPEVIVGLLPVCLLMNEELEDTAPASVGPASLLQPAALLSLKHGMLLPQGLCTISLLSLMSFKPLLHFWPQIRPTMKIPFHTSICCPVYPLHRAPGSLCSFFSFQKHILPSNLLYNLFKWFIVYLSLPTRMLTSQRAGIFANFFHVLHAWNNARYSLAVQLMFVE